MKAQITLVAASALAALAVGLQPAAHAAPDGAPRACFNTSQISAYRADGPNTVYASSGPQRVFRINMSSPCNNLADRGGQLLLEPPSTGVVCSAVGLSMTAISSGGAPERCFIASIERLDADEVAALPMRFRR